MSFGRGFHIHWTRVGYFLMEFPELTKEMCRRLTFILDMGFRLRFFGDKCDPGKIPGRDDFEYEYQLFKKQPNSLGYIDVETLTYTYICC
ncbi:hypothetical protein RIR_jg30875.t1 [Rhizophagus irregularis DAOM 181602=DAOM 197198]|nr:hypothetical protein RIR_jg30875.t1 [Rhizophagus irregularis DAOM 181602=DAOM 197198]